MVDLEKRQELIDKHWTYDYDWHDMENELNRVYADMLYRGIYPDKKPHGAIITNTTIDDIIDCYNEARNNDINFEY